MSQLFDKIRKDMFQAVKDKDKVTSAVTQISMSSLKNAEIDNGEPLNEDEDLQVLARERKKLADSIVDFENAGRSDLVAELNTQVAYLDRYLPEQMGEEEVRVAVQSKIESIGASGMNDIGKVMGTVMAELKGKADGAVVKKIVEEELKG